MHYHNKRKKHFSAHVSFLGKDYFLGVRTSGKAAARVYDKFVLHIYDKNKRKIPKINFPKSEYNDAEGLEILAVILTRW